MRERPDSRAEERVLERERARGRIEIGSDAEGLGSGEDASRLAAPHDHGEPDRECHAHGGRGDADGRTTPSGRQ